MNMDEANLKRAFSRMFDWLIDEKVWSGEEVEKRRREFVFHMLDWIDELPPLTDALLSGDDQTDEPAKMLFGFFVHGLNHLEAARLQVMPEYVNPFLDKQS